MSTSVKPCQAGHERPDHFLQRSLEQLRHLLDIHTEHAKSTSALLSHLKAENAQFRGSTTRPLGATANPCWLPSAIDENVISCETSAVVEEIGDVDSSIALPSPRHVEDFRRFSPKAHRRFNFPVYTDTAVSSALDLAGSVVEKKSCYASGRSFGRVFADANTLKDQLQGLLESDGDTTSSYYKEAGVFRDIALSRWFECVSMVMVVFSSAWIGIEIDLSPHTILTDAAIGFQMVAHIICAFFVVEMVVRFMAYKRTCIACKDVSFLVDCASAMLVAVETWVFTLIAAVLKWRSGSGGMRALLVLRTFRLARVLRLGRVLREFPELLVIIKGIRISLGAISIILALLSFIIYIGAIVFCVTTEGTALGNKRFKTVAAAMATLLLDCTLSGTKGGPVIREAYAQHFIFAVMLFLFVLLSNVTMMGVLGGLLVQTVRTTAELEKEQSVVLHVNHLVDEQWEEACSHDADGDGFLEVEELRSLFRDKGFAQSLISLDVDLEGFIDMSDFLVHQFDGKLSKRDLKQLILQLRGKADAKVKHHIETRKYVHSWIQDLRKMDYHAHNGSPHTIRE